MKPRRPAATAQYPSPRPAHTNRKIMVFMAFIAGSKLWGTGGIDVSEDGCLLPFVSQRPMFSSFEGSRVSLFDCGDGIDAVTSMAKLAFFEVMAKKYLRILPRPSSRPSPNHCRVVLFTPLHQDCQCVNRDVAGHHVGFSDALSMQFRPRGLTLNSRTEHFESDQNQPQD